MKLYQTRSSPYSRKVRMAAIELGLDDQLTLVDVSPLEDPELLIAVNPTSKVPVLETADCGAIYDSRVIVAYVAWQAADDTFYPRHADCSSWRALTVAAQCEAVVDAAVSLRLETLRPAPEQSISWKQRWTGQIIRNLDTLSIRLAGNSQYSLFLELNAVVALAYLDFRHPEINWRDGRPELGKLLAEWEKRSSFDKTRFPAN